MNLRRTVFTLVALLTFAMFVPHANAALQLSLSTTGAIGSTASVFITDGGAGDLSLGVDSKIIWSGVVGDWNLNVTTGIDKAAAAPLLIHLNSIDGHLAGSNTTLTIALSDTGFSPATAGLTAHVGGTLSAGGSLTSTAYYDPTNSGNFVTTPPGVSIGTLSGNTAAFSGSLSQAVTPASPFALTIVTTMNFGTAAGNGSFDATLDPVPEPSSVALLGGVLLATATALRRKLKRS